MKTTPSDSVRVAVEPKEGSRCAKNGPIRGLPDVKRDKSRSVLSLSEASNVRLPSELKKTEV